MRPWTCDVAHWLGGSGWMDPGATLVQCRLVWLGSRTPCSKLSISRSQISRVLDPLSESHGNSGYLSFSFRYVDITSSSSSVLVTHGRSPENLSKHMVLRRWTVVCLSLFEWLQSSKLAPEVRSSFSWWRVGDYWLGVVWSTSACLAAKLLTSKRLIPCFGSRSATGRLPRSVPLYVGSLHVWGLNK